LEIPGVEKVGILSFWNSSTVIWYILWSFGCLVAIWYIFPVFGIFCHEKKSGKPGRRQILKYDSECQDVATYLNTCVDKKN
jgi:hypothetical protein